MDISRIANNLYAAEQGAYQIPRLSAQYTEMTLADAYAIQLHNVARRKADGERLIGMKIGLTSKGMQRLLGVDTPDYGHLTDQMLLREGESCPIAELNQPKVEGELAFCLNKTLQGPGVTPEDVFKATEYVVPALEIVDSRITDWKITLEDTVADNGSSARLVLGTRTTPIEQVDMRLTGMILEKNGELANSGTTAEVLGSPAAAVAWLANALSDYGMALEAGSIILSGALTAALPAQAGDCFTASFHGLGSVSIRFA